VKKQLVGREDKGGAIKSGRTGRENLTLGEGGGEGGGGGGGGGGGEGGGGGRGQKMWNAIKTGINP